nr:HNH endonuclease [Clostridium estertheticum]
MCPPGSKKERNINEDVSKASEWSSEKGIYSVSYEANLPENMYLGVSYGRYFQEANNQLYDTFQSDSRFAQQIEELYPGIKKAVEPGKRGAFSRKPPTQDVTWHHTFDREGVLQLIPFKQHTAKGMIQSILHPGRKGGMENWGGGR